MNSLFETLKKLGALRMAILGIMMFMLLGFFVFISLKVSSPTMRLLYSDLAGSDSAAVAAKLEELKIPYQMSADGSRVMVTEAEVGRARMLLAEAGLPNGGSMGYEIFDQQSGFGQTTFVQNINQIRALEGELARTIAALGPVASARVHLVLPQRELFSRESRPASASVFVKLKASNRLSDEQILSVQSLVSSAVPDLKADHVSIIDNEGNLLARGGGESDEMAPVKTEEMRRSYEARLAAAIEDIVSRTVGFGKVRATVTADLNFDRISTNEEIFDPEQQVVRSSQSVNESGTERAPPSGDVGAGNNLPANISDVLVESAPSSQNNRTEETTNYEIGKTVRSMVREVGEVKRLSVAVLVDGIYTMAEKPAAETGAAKEGEQKEPEEKVYQPRSTEELKKIEDLVKSAIGFDEKRGDQINISNMQFATVEVPEMDDETKLLGFEKSDLLDAAQVIIVAIMIILVVLLILQPMVGRLLASVGPSLEEPPEGPDLLPARASGPALMSPQAAATEEEASAVEESLINVKSVEGKVKASAVKKVEDIVNAYPNETVSVIRSWMHQQQE